MTMTDASALPELPKVPFERAQELYPAARPAYRDGSGFDGVTPEVGGMFKLAPNAVFLSADVAEPFAFLASIAGRRTHVAVGREYGDLAWPAFVRRQRVSVTADVRRIVHDGPLADVAAWLADCERRADEERSDDHEEAPHDR